LQMKQTIRQSSQLAHLQGLRRGSNTSAKPEVNATQRAKNFKSQASSSASQMRRGHADRL